MDVRGRLTAQALARNLGLGHHPRLLDIAGGSGIYACSLAAHFPGLRATVLEKPPVDRIARRAVESHGFADRVDVIARDMLQDPLPGGYDVPDPPFHRTASVDSTCDIRPCEIHCKGCRSAGSRDS